MEQLSRASPVAWAAGPNAHDQDFGSLKGNRNRRTLLWRQGQEQGRGFQARPGTAVVISRWPGEGGEKAGRTRVNNTHGGDNNNNKNAYTCSRMTLGCVKLMAKLTVTINLIKSVSKNGCCYAFHALCCVFLTCSSPSPIALFYPAHSH